MFQGASIPFIAKLCAAAVVTTGAGVATYEVAIDKDPPAAEVEVASPADSLAFADEAVAPGKDEAPSVDDKHVEEPPAQEKDEAPDEHHDDVEAEAKKADEAETKKADDVEEISEKESEPKEPADTIAPELVILHPEDGSHFDDRKIVFEGESEPGARVKAGPYEADVDAEGNWRIELILSPGANRAVLTAYDEAGNVAEASVTVHLEVEPEEKADEPKTVEFSAKQKWGYCEEEVPYDVFWGTATPNTVVHIVSAHGGAEVEVDKLGHWEKKVWFETAPRGEAFVVVVEAVNGRSEFEFLAKPSAHEEVEK